MTDEQQAIVLLWQRVNTSLSAFYKLTKTFGSARLALLQSGTAWASLKIHSKHISRHDVATEITDQAFISNLNQRIHNGEFNLLFQGDNAYPPQLNQLFDPPPILFYRGNKLRLTQAQVAIVGSRKPSLSAQKLTFDMAQYLAQAGYVIVSGLAQGVDAQAHLGALAQSGDCTGRTVGVMGTGIDVCYPKNHKALIDRIVNEGGCIISELIPGTLPNKHTFPRRNRIVAGLGLGTVVTEATIKSGSLITARLTSEQGKQVFAIPSNIDNTNAEGCHHLIREGATLIYHPEQVIDDIAHQIISPVMYQNMTKVTDRVTQTVLSNAALDDSNIATSQSLFESSDSSSKLSPPRSVMGKPTNKVSNNTIINSTPKTSVQAIKVPDHLQPLWVHMDWEGQDLDALLIKTTLETSFLLSQLMELELLGTIVQVGGRYKRV